MDARTFRIVAPFAAVTILCATAYADPAFDGMIDTSSIGAADFLRSNPTADGRGVAIAILDSGVDMGVAGLDALPGGGVKVVVARDFTREAKIECGDSGRDQSGTINVSGGRITGIPDRVTGPTWAGFLEESRFRNSRVPDLNSNGRTDDRFAVVVFRNGAGVLRALVDTEGDGDMADAVELGTYEEAFETASFSTGRSFDAASPLTIAVNLEQRGSHRVEVGFHLATGAHGTHVAGIAAGHAVAGQPGYDGVAPGSVVLSLKIGNNSLPRGATVSQSMIEAFRYAADWGRQHNMPVVINISYGVGAEDEGNSEIARFCDGFAIGNPHVVIVTSAGNQGPGLSTVGTPASSSGVISVAALVTPDTGRELLGEPDLRDIRVFGFSSRGGELPKPDVAAPGIAASTVPAWHHGDVIAGTSMASPQVAGAVALVLSAMLQKHPDARWNSGMIMRALRAGARPIAGFSALDYGAGLINVPAAWAVFDKDVGRDFPSLIQSIRVETDVPTLLGRKGAASFWRAAGWAPSREEPATVRVSPVFSALAGERHRNRYFDRFKLAADQSWVHISRPSVHIRGESDAMFDIWVDQSRVSRPGVHVATVTGTSSSGLSFQFPVTVVTPWPDKIVNGIRKITFKGLKVSPGGLVRIPFMIPPASGMVAVKVSPSEGATADAAVRLYDGKGHPLAPLGGLVRSSSGDSVSGVMSPSEFLCGGTMEMVVAGGMGDASRVDIDIRFSQLAVGPIEWLRQEAGRLPRSSLTVLNNGGDAFSGSVEGGIEGFEVSRTVTMRGERFEERFSVLSDYKAVEFDLEMSGGAFGKFTDVTAAVYDSEGNAVVSAAFMDRKLVLRVPAGEGGGRGNYRLEVRGAFAMNRGDTPISMKTRYLFREEVKLVGTVAGSTLVNLYPGVSTPVEIEAQSIPPSIPSGAVWFGAVDFIDRHDRKTRGRSVVRAVPR